ncbi:hypothetical protein SeLEV6574_g08477, partial [Synchytrium endobioticum]
YQMGKNVMIVTVTALMVFFTLTQAAPPRMTDDNIKPSLQCIGHNLLPLLKKINAVEECIGNPTYRIETNTDVLHGDIKNRLISFLTLPLRMLNAGYTYTGLLGLVNQDIGWLPVYLAHEYLVIARALYDIKRMHYYTVYDSF